MTSGQAIPAASSDLCEQAIAFCTEVIDSSGVAERLEGLLERRTGRPRELKVRAILVALLLLALDERPLHIKAATKLLFCRLPEVWRQRLGTGGEPATKKAFLARYRQVRYLSHLALSVIDPSAEAKNRVVPEQELAGLRKKLSDAEAAVRGARLEAVINDLVESSARVCSSDELDRFDGSVGLDATPVPLWSRGPSRGAGTCASDPDGGWYIRQADHREATGPEGRALRKLSWALEATIATMGRPPASVPAHPNLVLGLALGRPGEDPGGTGVRVLASVRARGWPAKYLGADRGYTQGTPERFHLPVRAMGYSLVMDYKSTQLGRQANSQGAVMVDGTFYCPAMPEALVGASADHRAGKGDDDVYSARLAARTAWRLVRKSGPDKDGYERLACPAQGQHPHLCCPLRPPARSLGKVPVLAPPALPPKLCTQSAVTIAPDIGPRHRQDLAFGTEEWARTYATYRNSTEGTNGYLKDTAHESLACPGRRRVRGIAAQSLFVALLLMALSARSPPSARWWPTAPPPKWPNEHAGDGPTWPATAPRTEVRADYRCWASCGQGAPHWRAQRAGGPGEHAYAVLKDR
ncbi:MAG TPA: hypothetical protein VME46_04545 [Acidimicrobiales bacterium]|nr:hypothetical protein [Acidimicrobiales bacterium]